MDAAALLQRIRADVVKEVRAAINAALDDVERPTPTKNVTINIGARKNRPIVKRRVQGKRAASRKEMTKWAADKAARRVPTFVIEMTGLDTKKKIVAKFGEGATFEKGKPLPTPKKAA